MFNPPQMKHLHVARLSGTYKIPILLIKFLFFTYKIPMFPINRVKALQV